eukprot:Mrub_11791.p1 GENE.Mrub_11791~~Mrub_11791.p1  ORF type:complete len:117 (+),score=17.90 Mrub_11791:187-537(+)
MTHEALNAINKKLGITSSCQAGPETNFRFAQNKSLPEEIAEPEPQDLKTMVVVSQLYNDTISSKPVYTIALHIKIKKANNNNSLDLPRNLMKGADADFVLNHQIEKVYSTWQYLTS